MFKRPRPGRAGWGLTTSLHLPRDEAAERASTAGHHLHHLRLCHFLDVLAAGGGSRPSNRKCVVLGRPTPRPFGNVWALLRRRRDGLADGRRGGVARVHWPGLSLAGRRPVVCGGGARALRYPDCGPLHPCAERRHLSRPHRHNTLAGGPLHLPFGFLPWRSDWGGVWLAPLPFAAGAAHARHARRLDDDRRHLRVLAPAPVLDRRHSTEPPAVRA